LARILYLNPRHRVYCLCVEKTRQSCQEGPLSNLQLSTIHLIDGARVSTLPGLIALTPPKKCARGRDNDQLIALVHLTGQSNITGDAMQGWLLKKSAFFYSTPGSVVTAMRLMAESINNELFDRNLKKGFEGSRVNGSLCMLVIRKETAYCLVIGDAKIYLLAERDAIEIVDRENPSDGLGISQVLNCAFSQHTVKDGDAFLMAAIPSPLWTVTSLDGGGKLATDVLMTRLLNQHPGNLKGVLVRLQQGNGKITLQQEATGEYTAVEPLPVTPRIPVGEDLTSRRAAPAAIPDVNPLTPRYSAPDEGEEPGEVATAEGDLLPGIDIPGATMTEGGSQARVTPRRRERQEAKTPASRKTDELKVHVGNYVNAADQLQDRVKTGLAGVISKVDPDAENGGRIFSRSFLLLLAILVPIIVVAMATSIYTRQGKTQQFDMYYTQGQEYAAQAEVQKQDPILYLFNLQASMMYLDKAAEFGSSEEYLNLRVQVQANLDEIQGVSRLNLTRLAISNNLVNTNISQAAATNTDLYLLDKKQGKVLRFYLSGSEFVADEKFDCGPNPNSPVNRIGKLVDMVTLPTGNSFNATIFAIDAYGNIEFCTPGDTGSVSSLIAPDAGWQEIKAISLFQNYLYVLDPGNNGVYRYTGNGIFFEEKPVLFFDNVIPSLVDAVDIEVNGDELYVLRSGGEMVECTYSHMKDYKLTECVDPAPYSDMRAGGAPEAINFPDAQFVQMKMTAAPDSSIYLLDTHGNSLFHFSLQRNLQRILTPGYLEEEAAPKNEATAVAISPGRLIFVAFGNQVYYGTMP